MSGLHDLIVTNLTGAALMLGGVVLIAGMFFGIVFGKLNKGSAVLLIGGTALLYIGSTYLRAPEDPTAGIRRAAQEAARLAAEAAARAARLAAEAAANVAKNLKPVVARVGRFLEMVKDLAVDLASEASDRIGRFGDSVARFFRGKGIDTEADARAKAAERDRQRKAYIKWVKWQRWLAANRDGVTIGRMLEEETDRLVEQDKREQAERMRRLTQPVPQQPIRVPTPVVRGRP